MARVVFVSEQFPESGGGGSSIEALSGALTSAGVDVTHVSMYPGSGTSTFPTQVILRLGRAHRRPAFRGSSGWKRRVVGATRALHKRGDLLRGRRRLRRLLESLDSSAVVVFTSLMPKVEVDAAGVRWQARRPILVGQHHSSFEAVGRTWETEAFARHYGDLDLFVGLTEADACKLQTIVPTKCASVPNIAPLFERGGSTPGRVVIALARYAPEKQLDAMIRMFADASRPAALRGWELRLYGEGPCRRDLEALIDDLDIGHRVRLMGRTADVQGALADAAVNVVSSAFEGLPMSILESSSMGVPTVAFDCSPGVREVVPAEAGVLVPPNDCDAFTAALQRLMADDAERADKGDAAIRLAERYRPDTIVDRWFNLIEECYSDRRRSSSAARTAG